jgi:hypothetical protein
MARRNPHDESGALTHFAANGNRAAVGFDNPLGNGQTESGSTITFRSVKHLEYLRQLIRLDSGPVVGDRNGSGIAVGLDFDFDFAATVFTVPLENGVHAIPQEIEDDTMNAPAIDLGE